MTMSARVSGNRFAWAVFCCLFVGGMSGCTASGSDCSQDSDCPVNQQCSMGGGVFFGGGVCLSTMSGVGVDVGGEASDTSGDLADTDDEQRADVEVSDVLVNDVEEQDGSVGADTSVGEDTLEGGDTGDVNTAN